MINMDIAGWTLVFAILAVVVPLGLYIYVQWPKAVVEITSVDDTQRIHITIRNDGQVDLVIANPGYVVVEPRSHLHGRAAMVRPTMGQVAFMLKNGELHSHFPLRLQGGDEGTTEWARSHFADDVWMADCIAPCRVRGAYQTTRRRLLRQGFVVFRSAPIDVPFDDWLPADASARMVKPRS
jgi:hypothetical protein